MAVKDSCLFCHRGGAFGKSFASLADGGSNPARDRPKLIRQIVTAPLPNAGHQRVSRDLGGDLYTDVGVTVGVAR